MYKKKLLASNVAPIAGSTKTEKIMAILRPDSENIARIKDNGYMTAIQSLLEGKCAKE
jgi:hypothetical protein